jgi:predicted homoserine dehydrogenase-like protein
MIILDTKLQELEEKNSPIRVGLIGAGFAGRGLALQLLTIHQGMRLVVVSNRTLEYARQAYTDALGNTIEIEDVQSEADLEVAISTQKYAITNNPSLLCKSPSIDVIVEATGEVEFGASVAIEAIKNKKHIILINAELDATLGPILKHYADASGVIYAQAEGDQPGKLMNLFREITGLGFTPLLAGNIKSLIDPYRTPKTQAKFAREHFQRAKMITSFADGTKISMEMATVANATGFKVGKRGMFGPQCSSVDQAALLFPVDTLLKGGIVDYILGAEPSFGVFFLAYNDNPIRQKYMNIYKMGNGPVYTFYIPYHLSPLEAPMSIARAVLFRDAALKPKGGLMTEVITLAKKNLKPGDILDGIGGFTCYGVLENYEIASTENLLPMGLSDGCRVNRDIPKDTPVAYSDVILPKNRLSDKLRKEQDQLIF